MDYIFKSTETGGKKKKLQVKIGPTLETLSIAAVNSDQDVNFIDSPLFCGQFVIRIKNFAGITPNGEPVKGYSESYFDGKKRLFALQLSGRFKHVIVNLTLGIYGG